MKLVFTFVAALMLFTTVKSIPGGVTLIDPDLTDENVVFAANAVNEYFQEMDQNAEPYSAIEVINATKQVVRGMRYRYTLKMSNGGLDQICRVSVLSQPWLQEPDNLRTLDILCEPELLLGGEHPANWESPLVRQALAAFIQHVNDHFNSEYRMLPGGGQITQQVVNGLIFRFRGMRMMTTSCSNDDDSSAGKMSLEECPVWATFAAVPTPICDGSIYWDRHTFEVRGIHCAVGL